MDYKKLSKNLKDARWTNAGMTDDQSLEWDASDAITELLARAEEAEERCKELEARCKRLDEARERANEAAAKWESAYKIAMGQKEKAQREAEEERREATLCRNDPKKCGQLVQPKRLKVRAKNRREITVFALEEKDKWRHEWDKSWNA